jgi:uncharacterized protein with FMN-binding domain
MRRAPIVIAATVAGLAGVLAFHTSPVTMSLGVGATLPRGSSSLPVATGSPGPSSPGTTAPSPSGSSSPTTAGSGTKTATGSLVNYNYGELSVSVTVAGGKITDVTIASLDDGGNFRSASIDQQSIPILEQQALQAQSANIQGVSGATYTSEGFSQSLQSALTRLGR